MDMFGAKSYKLRLVNDTEFEKLHASLECEGSSQESTNRNRKKHSIGHKVSVQNVVIHHRKKHKMGAKLIIKPGSYCELTFKNPDEPSKVYGVKLIPENENSKIRKLQGHLDQCSLSSDTYTGTERMFLTSDYNSMTCPQKIGSIRTLENPIDGLQAKAEALLGQKLTDEIVNQKNPFLPLDFSKAPKLDVILISYLVFRGDFYGNLLGRLVNWHADRGTKVRIIVSHVIELEKDKLMLQKLQEKSDNIRIQEFHYNSRKLSAGDQLSQLHRTNHVKLFITLSEDPKHNHVVIGGRNVHDGFVFKDVPDHSAFPELVQYGKGAGKDESYAFWRDFEMIINSKDLAERIAAHYLAYWEMDKKHFTIRSINENRKAVAEEEAGYFKLGPDENRIRHFVSIPFRDDHLLEKLYVDLFDSAEKNIRLSTPYFRPTKKIGEALFRAINRGVKVYLITRLDMEGDTADFILGDVNKTGVNKFLNQVKIYEYTEPAAILHSKLVLIDDKFSFVGSVNMNKRSFIHDMENSVMVYGPEFNQRMSTIMESYYKISKEITKKQKVVLWKKILIKIIDKAI